MIATLLFVGCSETSKSVTNMLSESVHSREINTPEWINDAVIYEVNIRQYTPEGTFSAFSKHLPRLKNLGVKIIWIMPVHAIGQKKRAGKLGSYYSVKDYYSINPEFGDEKDFKELISKIHENEMYVIIDWVPNHTSWDNNLVNENPEYYQKNRNGDFQIPVGTPWNDVIALDYKNDGLRAYMKTAMKHWVSQYDIDGFRCDVAGYIPIDFWREIRYELDQIKPVFMLAEWEDQLMHEAFEMTYAWELESIFQQVYAGKKDASAIYEYISKVYNVYDIDELKMNFTSNHDKNSWEGSVFERFGKAAEVFAVFTYLNQGMPLIYSGQEVGNSKQLPFFEKDSIEWGDHPFNALYSRLSKLKKDNKALWNGKSGGKLIPFETPLPNQLVAFSREKDGNKVLAVFNFSDKSVNTKMTFEGEFGNYKSFKNRSSYTIDQNFPLKLKPWGYEVLIAR